MSNRYVALAVAALLLGALTFKTIQSFYVWYQSYEQTCTNRDVLGWDGNLRFTSVLEYNRDIREGRLAHPIVDILQSPTWPPFRKVLSLGVALAGNPSPVKDTLISTFFSILLIIALPLCGWVLLRKEEGLWSGAAAGLILLTMREFPIYSFAAMLETQGMFFFLLASAAYYLNRDAGFASGPRSRLLPWILFISFFGLYMTKYPYGVLFLMSIGLIEGLSYFRRFLRLLKENLLPHYWIRPSLFFIALFVFAVAVFVLHKPLGLPEARKFYKQLLYGSLLLFFIDLLIYWFRSRTQLRRLMLGHHRRLFAWGVLPIAIWFLSSPDRFGAFLGAGLHVQEQGRVFVWSLLVDTLRFPLLMPAVISLLLFGMFVVSRGRRNVRTWLRDPLNAMVLVILGNLALLEILTANKQFRHIYHLVPALLLVSFLVLFKRYRPGHTRPGVVSARGSVGEALGLVSTLLLAACILVFPNTLGANPAKDYVCFTGDDPAPLAPARRIANQVPLHDSVVVWNRFHELDSPSPGRLLASEMDLLIRYRTDGKARNDSRYELDNWNRFDHFLFIGFSCKEADLESVRTLIEQRQKVTLIPQSTYFDESGICSSLFKIEQ